MLTRQASPSTQHNRVLRITAELLLNKLRTTATPCALLPRLIEEGLKVGGDDII